MKDFSYSSTNPKVPCLALLLLNGSLLYAVSEKPSIPCPIKADLWVTTGQSNMASNDSTGKPAGCKNYLGARLKSCNNYSVFVLFSDNRYDSLLKFFDGGHIDVSRTCKSKRQ
jgi:hypothetical protein